MYREPLNVILLVLVVCVVAGCATATYRKSPEDQATDYTNSAADKYKAGNFSQAYVDLSTAIARPTGPEKVKALFLREPKLAEGYQNYLRAEIANVNTPHRAKLLKEDIDRATRVLPRETATELDSLIEARVSAGNASGSISFDFSDDYSMFKSLQTPEQKQKIAEHTIATLQDPSGAFVRPVAQLMSYAGEVGVSSPMGERIRASLPTMNLRRSELQEVARLYPEFAADQLANATVKVRLIVEPRDRLLQEDVAAGLRKDLKGVELVQDDGPQVVTITVERLRYNENRLQDRTETVTYRQYEVNIIGAALLMPQNASYLYDVTTSGGEIEYGFVVKASQSGRLLADDVLRDRITYSNSTCTNARIQNVFGGVQRAEFVANDDMVRRCSGSSSNKSIDDLRAEVYARITKMIAALPPIARAQLLAN